MTRIYKVVFQGKKDGRTYVYETSTEAENIEDAREIAEAAKGEGEKVKKVKFLRNA